MPPKMEIWTSETEELLISLVKTRPILWDVTQKTYRRNDLKEIHWEEISMKMGASYTVEHVKKRWNNIRGTFLDNDKKVRESKRSGSSVEDIFKPKWSLYSQLLFLRKTIASAQSISNLVPYVPIRQHLSSQSQVQSTEDWLDSNDTVNISSLEIPCDTQDTALTLIPQNIQTEYSQSSIESLEEVNESHSISPISVPASTSSSTSQSLSIAMPERLASDYIISGKKHTGDEALYVKRKTSKKLKNEFAMEEAVDAIKQIASQPIIFPQYPDRPTQDTIDHFTAYVGATLREMSPQRRKLLEKEIMDILFAARSI